MASIGQQRRKDAVTAQLGMPLGTARHKLVKSILFKLLNDTGQNTCFVCGLKIEEINQLSIEHIKPWEGRDAALYWDLENIAFSHLRCNILHDNNGPIAQRRVGPPGTVWCYSHQSFLPISEFHANKTKWNGVNGDCKQCKENARKSKKQRGKDALLE